MYNNFVEEAVRMYRELPYENNELYKRYRLKFDLPEIDNSRSYTENVGRWSNIAESVSKDIRIRFDAVIYNGRYLHTSDSTKTSISAIKTSDMPREMMEQKLFHSSDDKFAAYTHAYSKLSIEITGEGDAAANILFITDSESESLPIQLQIKGRTGSKILINEFYVSSGNNQTVCGAMHEIIAHNGSHVELTMLHIEGVNVNAFSLVKGEAHGSGIIKTNLISAGGRMFRHRNDLVAKGKGSTLETNDTIIGFGSQSIDVGTNTRNAERATNSNSTIRAIVLDRSSAFIKGFAKIEKGCSGSVSRINEHGLIGDKDAFLYLIPDMSIDESDVIATHSSASAPIDSEKVFYMQSRGIMDSTAQFLIMNGLISETISKITDNEMRMVSYSIAADRVKSRSPGVSEAHNISELWLHK